MRIKVFKICPEFFPEMFKTDRCLFVRKGIPEGAIFRGFNHDLETNCLAVYVEHDSFEMVGVGMPYPIEKIELGDANIYV